MSIKNTQDSPGMAKLRATVNKIRGRESYSTMTNDELKYTRKKAFAWLEEHPTNEEALKRYELLVEEMERRGI